MLRKNRHSIYDLEYHLVVVIKYRHKVLKESVKERLIQLSFKLFEKDYPCYINEINTSVDHVHILFEAPPQVQLSKLINSYKTVTSRLLRKEFSEYLSKYYWKPYFWSNSYFIGSVSESTNEAVKKYIQEQEQNVE